MENDTLKAVVRNFNRNGLDAWQPGVVVESPFGAITHWAKGLAYCNRKDAMAVAEKLAEDSREVGYVTC